MDVKSEILTYPPKGEAPVEKKRPKVYSEAELAEKTRQAEERIARMPEGFMTPGLLFHYTRLRSLGSILERGVMSAADQEREYGKPVRGSGTDLQSIWGQFDKISVWDIWSGYGTRKGDVELAEYLRHKKREMFFNYCEENGYRPLELLDRLSELKLAVFLDPQHSKLVEQYQSVYNSGLTKRSLEMSHVAQQMIDNKSALIFFNPRSEEYVGLLIDPKKPRTPTFSSGMSTITPISPESFVTKIEPTDIIGFVIRKTIATGELDNALLERMRTIAINYGMPLYLYNDDLQGHHKISLEPIWPTGESIYSPKFVTHT